MVLLRALLVFLAPAFLLYSATAFAYWSANPGEWPDKARYFVASAGLICGFILSLAYTVAGLHKTIESED